MRTPFTGRWDGPLAGPGQAATSLDPQAAPVYAHRQGNTMLSPQLRRKVHDLWSLFWSSGLSNPLVAIEQITYLLFIRQLEALDRVRVEQGKYSIYALTVEEKKQRDKLVAELKKANPKTKPDEIAA